MLPETHYGIVHNVDSTSGRRASLLFDLPCSLRPNFAYSGEITGEPRCTLRQSVCEPLALGFECCKDIESNDYAQLNESPVTGLPNYVRFGMANTHALRERAGGAPKT